MRQERNIPKRRSLLRQGEHNPVKCFRFVDAEKDGHSIAMLCRVLQVARAGYDA